MNIFDHARLLLSSFVGRLLGRTDDPVYDVDANDEEMNAAIEQARATVGEFVHRLQNPRPKDGDFSVKKKIDEGERSEHFWLKDISHADGVFTGTVGNAPQSIRNVKYGDRVTVAENNITDWMYLDDGKMAGNFTLRVLLKHMPEQEATLIRAHFQIDE